MFQSESIAKITAALVKAQQAFLPAAKSAENPFYKSMYVPLDALWLSVKKPLHDNGLAVTMGGDGNGNLRVLLSHTSGEYIVSLYPIVSKADKDGNVGPQAQGSAMSYAERYALKAITGNFLISEDDDGEAAQGRNNVDAVVSHAKKKMVKREAKKETVTHAEKLLTKTKIAELYSYAKGFGIKSKLELAPFLREVGSVTTAPAFPASKLTALYDAIAKAGEKGTPE